jgi:hypothetical protein
MVKKTKKPQKSALFTLQKIPTEQHKLRSAWCYETGIMIRESYWMESVSELTCWRRFMGS